MSTVLSLARYTMTFGNFRIRITSYWDLAKYTIESPTRLLSTQYGTDKTTQMWSKRLVTVWRIGRVEIEHNGPDNKCMFLVVDRMPGVVDFDKIYKTERLP